MKRSNLLVGAALAVVIALGLLGSQTLSAQEPLKEGKVIQRTTLTGAPGLEAILVERDLPPGVESGKHTQGGNEIVYIATGAVIVQIEGKPDQTVKAGEAFTTSAGQVHNVKNASKTEPAKALAFYVAKKGAKMEDLSKPTK
jgi:quercetin dioxygenase-like cupin family protein